MHQAGVEPAPSALRAVCYALHHRRCFIITSAISLRSIRTDILVDNFAPVVPHSKILLHLTNLSCKLGQTTLHSDFLKTVGKLNVNYYTKTTQWNVEKNLSLRLTSRPPFLCSLRFLRGVRCVLLTRVDPT